MNRFAKYFSYLLILSIFLYFSLHLPQSRLFFTAHAFSTLSELFIKQSVKSGHFEIQGNEVVITDVELEPIPSPTSNRTLLSFWLSLFEFWLVDVNHIKIYQLTIPNHHIKLTSTLHCDSSSLYIDSLEVQKDGRTLYLTSAFIKEGAYLHLFGEGSFQNSKDFPLFSFEMHWEPVDSFYAPISFEIKDTISFPFSGGNVVIDRFCSPLELTWNEKQEMNLSGNVADAWVQMPKEDITIGPLSGHFNWTAQELNVNNITTTFNDVVIQLEYLQTRDLSTITCKHSKGSLGHFQSLLKRWYPSSFLRHIPVEGILEQTEPLIWENQQKNEWTLKSTEFVGRLQDAGVILSSNFLLDAINCDITYGFNADHLTIDGLEGCLLISETDPCEYLVYADTLTFSPISLSPFPFDIWLADGKNQLARFKGDAKIMNNSLILDCIPKWTHLGPYYLDEAHFSFKEKKLLDSFLLKGKADSTNLFEFVKNLPLDTLKDKHLHPIEIEGELDIVVDWISNEKSIQIEVSSDTLLLQGKILNPFHLQAQHVEGVWQIDDLSWNDWSVSGEIITLNESWKIPSIALQSPELFIGGQGVFYPLENRFLLEPIFLRIPSIETRFDAKKPVEFQYYLQQPHMIYNLSVEDFNIQTVSLDVENKLIKLKNVQGFPYLESLDFDMKNNLEGLAFLKFNWKTLALQKPKSLEFLPWDLESILPKKAGIYFHLTKEGIVGEKIEGCESDGGFLHYQLDSAQESICVWQEGLSIFGQMVFHHPTLKKKEPITFTIQGSWQNPVWKWK